jgi:NADH-quinone oxidoreductase subunit M
MVKRILFGEVANSHVAELTEINAREAWVLGLFAVGVLLLGVYPKPLTDLMDASVVQLVSQLSATKLVTP